MNEQSTRVDAYIFTRAKNGTIKALCYIFGDASCRMPSWVLIKPKRVATQEDSYCVETVHGNVFLLPKQNMEVPALVDALRWLIETSNGEPPVAITTEEFLDAYR